MNFDFLDLSFRTRNFKTPANDTEECAFEVGQRREKTDNLAIDEGFLLLLSLILFSCLGQSSMELKPIRRNVVEFAASTDPS